MIGHFFYLWLQILITIFFAEAVVRYYMAWERATAGEIDWMKFRLMFRDADRSYPFVLLGSSGTALCLLVWSITFVASGIAHRSVSTVVGISIDFGLLLSFGLKLVPLWVIELHMTFYRVVWCIIVRVFIAAAISGVAFDFGL